MMLGYEWWFVYRRPVRKNPFMVYPNYFGRERGYSRSRLKR